MIQHHAEDLERLARQWEERGRPRPRGVLVAGSGLSVDFGGARDGPHPLAELLPFPVAAIEGHPLSYEIVEVQPGVPLLYLRGRLHAYQGYSAQQVVFAVRLARLLGAHTLFVTNAAGCLDPLRGPGTLVLLRDHVNLTGLNPLIGSMPAAWGPQFPDMVDAYDPQLRERVRARGAEIDVALSDGVYVGLLGPTFETPAEIEMLRRMGADLVGMSTVLEVIAARHMGMRCLGLSLVTNLAAGMASGPLDHELAMATGRAAASSVARLWQTVLSDPEILAQESS